MYLKAGAARPLLAHEYVKTKYFNPSLPWASVLHLSAPVGGRVFLQEYRELTHPSNRQACHIVAGKDPFSSLVQNGTSLSVRTSTESLSTVACRPLSINNTMMRPVADCKPFPDCRTTPPAFPLNCLSRWLPFLPDCLIPKISFRVEPEYQSTSLNFCSSPKPHEYRAREDPKLTLVLIHNSRRSQFQNDRGEFQWHQSHSTATRSIPARFPTR
jgi:hypothetical protein